MTRKRRRSNAPLQTEFLPQELITEILAFLDVKTILRLKCLSKSWNTLISHSMFVEKHLKNSSQNPQLTLVWHQRKLSIGASPYRGMPDNVQFHPVHSLLKKPSINVYRKYIHGLEHCCKVVGSCNGLVCLLYCTWRHQPQHTEYWLRFWNPATRKRSKVLGFFSDPMHEDYKFTFGYDASRRTYKVVAVRMVMVRAPWKKVKVFSLRRGCWRNIQSFPAVNLNSHMVPHSFSTVPLKNDGVHLNGNVNWLAEDESKHLVIVSLDLSTETYKQFLLPPGVDDVLYFQLQPLLRVLMGSLCFSHDSNKTEFVLWQMKEYGVQESWTQLFKISYQNLLQMHLPMDINIIFDYNFQLTCLYVNHDTVIFATQNRIGYRSEIHYQAFIYNLKDKTVEKIKCKTRIQWFEEAKDYVESLVSVPWEE